MDKLNTHYYDGKLVINFVIPSLPDKAIFLQCMNELYSNLLPYLTKSAQHNFSVIINSDKTHNFDSTNNLYADQLLYACYILFTNKTF